MSTLKVNTVQHNTTGFNNVVQFTDGAGTENGTLCRAWVNFNGTGTVAIRADFNVSSITDIALGQYTVNFSNALSDANYAAVVTSYYTNATNQNGYISYEDSRLTARTSSSFTLATSTTSVYNDSAIISVIIHR